MSVSSGSRTSLTYESKKGDSTQSNTNSGSDDSVDKDDLIDEMQIKFGELLDANQKLGNTKRQVEALKQQLSSQQDSFERERKSLNNEIQRLKDELAHQKNLATTMQNEISGYRQKIDEKDDAYRKLKEEFSVNEANSRTDFNNLLEKQKRDFQALLDKKDNDLKELHKQMVELRAENVTNNDSMLKKHIELEKLTLNKGKLETQLRRLENEKNEADERAASLRQLIHKMKDEKQSLSDKISLNEQQIEKYKSEVHAQQTVIESQKDDIEELQEKMAKVQEILPHITDFNQLVDELSDRVELAEKLPKELKLTKKQLRKAIKELGLSQSETERFGEQISSLKEDSSMLQNTIEDLNTKNEQLINQIQLLRNAQKNTKVIESANREFSHRINAINSALKGISNTPSLRTIIIATVISKRWSKINKLPKVYENDYRNWWWICGNDPQVHKINEPFAIIKDLQNSKSKLLKKIEHLVLIIKDAEKLQNMRENQLAEKDHLILIAKAKEEELNDQINNLTTQMQQTIDHSEFSKLSEKYASVKNSLKEVTAALEQSKDEIMQLKHENVMLKQKQTEFSDIKSNKERNEQALKSKLSEAEDEITLLRQALSSKNREIASLEYKTGKISAKYINMPNNNSEQPTNDAHQQTEISYCSSSMTNVKKPLQERLLAMSRLIN
ncbi:hypothetical protein TVAG_505040 [Trichomonas vaginalis G3]|uniref:Uncharacterized protein n=1 Tax=Trichomonas vaginalis (strain ATCC PRA-98 / G3) TaxID=412133 RepID=A2GB68_TRIV3|nr:hypothetical protein TVAGG3_0419160 [Trichomonas vaginalis G3]EAX85601.1 hypothetical protein TVAG_505040 [Trichomonas vaginalis G3]KAI5535918.1 hypothetical protein TVAGG3_0419160 [Trichomonas vaginalis G3]|eukprot:XP_001298531.1 hypothetical protein [Trichomonas vaginalis G3]